MSALRRAFSRPATLTWAGWHPQVRDLHAGCGGADNDLVDVDAVGLLEREADRAGDRVGRQRLLAPFLKRGGDGLVRNVVTEFGGDDARRDDRCADIVMLLTKAVGDGPDGELAGAINRRRLLRKQVRRLGDHRRASPGA